MKFVKEKNLLENNFYSLFAFKITKIAYFSENAFAAPSIFHVINYFFLLFVKIRFFLRSRGANRNLIYRLVISIIIIIIIIKKNCETRIIMLLFFFLIRNSLNILRNI